MANFVLIHGGNVSSDTWNEIAGKEVYPAGQKLGGKAWDPIIAPLRAHRHRAWAPTLQDEHKTDLSGHISQICSLITDNNLKDVILVGHSYGGMVITGVASRLPKKIKRLVYVDAAWPEPGQSLFDLIASGGCDPHAIIGLEPVAPYLEKLRFDPRKIGGLPKTYISCEKSDFAAVTQLVKQRIVGKVDWTLVELPTGHLPMITMPEALAHLLLEPEMLPVEPTNSPGTVPAIDSQSSAPSSESAPARKMRKLKSPPPSQEGTIKDKAKKPPRRPAPLAGNKRQRKAFHSRGGGR
jgi:pimeloyl-ACP methyl ester carboxylesterase